MRVVLATLAAWAAYTLVAGRRWPGRCGRLGGAGARPEPFAPGRGGRRRRGHGPRATAARTAADPAPDLATCADVMVVAALAGHGPLGAIEAAAEASGGPVGAALTRALAEHRRGADLSVALDTVVDRAGPQVHALVAAVRSALAEGTPLAPSLHRLADAERLRTRRRIETRVRRLPVLLLLPLVTLVLPAFVLVTLVPVGVTVGRDISVSGPLHPPSATHRGAISDDH